jgi:hypothetical protein
VEAASGLNDGLGRRLMAFVEYQRFTADWNHVLGLKVKRCPLLEPIVGNLHREDDPRKGKGKLYPVSPCRVRISWFS